MPSVPLLLTDEQRAFYANRPTGGVEFIEDYIIKERKNPDGSPVIVDEYQAEVINTAWKGLWPVVPAGRGGTAAELEGERATGHHPAEAGQPEDG